jgi:hypothetical protein
MGALRGVALGRKNWLFAGSDKSGERRGVDEFLPWRCVAHHVEAA